MTFHESVLSLATSQNWIALGINLLLTTVIGGIVIVILLSILGRVWRQQVKIQNAFIMVFVITAINYFGVLALLAGYAGGFSLIIPLIIWILLSKAFFSQLAWKQTLIVGVVGYALSIFLIPTLLGAASSYIPVF